MSNRAHSGRCFRSKRATIARKKRQGVEYDPHPIRYKVPLAIMPFLFGNGNQARAQLEQMGRAIVRYNEHQAKIGGKLAVAASG